MMYMNMAVLIIAIITTFQNDWRYKHFVVSGLLALYYINSFFEPAGMIRKGDSFIPIWYDEVYRSVLSVFVISIIPHIGIAVCSIIHMICGIVKAYKKRNSV